MQDNKTKGVDSARRVLQILLSFSDTSPETTVEQISEEFEISIPSAYRYISLLRELYLIEERGRGGFVLTPKFFKLAKVAEKTLDIEAVAMPILNRIGDEVNETVLILRRLKESVLCVASTIPDLPAKISFKPGQMMPLYRGAGPKLLLSALAPDQREKYLNKLSKSHTVEEIQDLRQELQHISKQKYAISAAEVDEGIYAIAAPIIVEGRTIAALSIAGLDFRLNEEQKHILLTKVQAGAREISALMSKANNLSNA